MTDLKTATEVGQADRDRNNDERSVHARMKWFTEKWTVAMDLNKRDAAEFAGDMAVVVQAIHRDASRETHALLTAALMAMPNPTILMNREHGPAPDNKIGTYTGADGKPHPISNL